MIRDNVVFFSYSIKKFFWFIDTIRSLQSYEVQKKIPSYREQELLKCLNHIMKIKK